MLKVVLDANIFVSAVLKPHSDLARILRWAGEEKRKLILSEGILSEVKAVLLYPKIKKRHRLTPKDIGEFLERLLGSVSSLLRKQRSTRSVRIPRTINTCLLL